MIVRIERLHKVLYEAETFKVSTEEKVFSVLHERVLKKP